MPLARRSRVGRDHRDARSLPSGDTASSAGEKAATQPLMTRPGWCLPGVEAVRNAIDDRFSDVVVRDIWDEIPEAVRDELIARRAASSDPGAFGRQDPNGRRWEPLRPVVLDRRAYRRLESIVARLLILGVESCRRRASTLGELHQALRFPYELPLMDPDGPLVASELTRCARPDLLVERGQPRIVEFNIGTRLGGGTLAPRMAQGYARLCPEAGLCPPPSAVIARSQAMVQALGGEVGDGKRRRLAIPAYWTVDEAGRRRQNKKVKKLVLAEVMRAGFEVVRPDLGELRLDATGRLLAADEPIDLVLIQWGSAETAHIVDGVGGLAALRGADRAGTVALFPRTESVLISSKTVLAWLHEDADAGLLAPTDRHLVRTHVPRTAVLGLDGPAAEGSGPQGLTSERDRVVLKPAVGRSGDGVLFGSRTTQQDWLSQAMDAAREAPVVLQERVEPDQVTMPFFDQVSGQQVVARVPFLLSPFLIDGAAADVSVRHMTPDTPTGDVVISVDRGGCWNTVVLIDDHLPRGSRPLSADATQPRAERFG